MCFLNHSGNMFSSKTIINAIVNRTPRTCPVICESRLFEERIILLEVFRNKLFYIFSKGRGVNNRYIMSKSDHESSDS